MGDELKDKQNPSAISADEQDYVRELLQLAVIDELLGPAAGPVKK